MFYRKLVTLGLAALIAGPIIITPKEASSDVLCTNMHQLQKGPKCVFEFEAFVAKNHCGSGGGPWITMIVLRMWPVNNNKELGVKTVRNSQQVKYNDERGAHICGGGNEGQCIRAVAAGFNSNGQYERFKSDKFCWK